MKYVLNGLGSVLGGFLGLMAALILLEVWDDLRR